MTIRFLYRAAAVAFGVTLAYTALLSRVLPGELASPSGAFRTPILAFELARTRAELLSVFGPADDPARPARIAAMLLGHELDAGYLVVYNVFLGLLLAAIACELGQRARLVALGLPLCAAAADAWENVILVALLGTIDRPEALLPSLALATWSKWGAIALGTAAAGAGLFAAGRRIVGVVALLPVPVVILAWLEPPRFGEMLSAGVAIPWLSLAVHALRQARATST